MERQDGSRNQFPEYFSGELRLWGRRLPALVALASVPLVACLADRLSPYLSSDEPKIPNNHQLVVGKPWWLKSVNTPEGILVAAPKFYDPPPVAIEEDQDRLAFEVSSRGGEPERLENVEAAESQPIMAADEEEPVEEEALSLQPEPLPDIAPCRFGDLIAEYFPRAEWEIACQVMMAESKGDPAAVSYDPKSGYHIGLFQMSTTLYSHYVNGNVNLFKDPRVNIESAARLFNWVEAAGFRGWSHWEPCVIRQIDCSRRKPRKGFSGLRRPFRPGNRLK